MMLQRRLLSLLVLSLSAGLLATYTVNARLGGSPQHHNQVPYQCGSRSFAMHRYAGGLTAENPRFTADYTIHGAPFACITGGWTPATCNSWDAGYINCLNSSPRAMPLVFRPAAGAGTGRIGTIWIDGAVVGGLTITVDSMPALMPALLVDATAGIDAYSVASIPAGTAVIARGSGQLWLDFAE